MTSPKQYDRIAFVASAGAEAQQALAQLVEIYGDRDPADADVVVALEIGRASCRERVLLGV
jgi:NAD+ kinase